MILDKIKTNINYNYQWQDTIHLLSIFMLTNRKTFQNLPTQHLQENPLFLESLIRKLQRRGLRNFENQGVY